jgi:hypothetical protein
VFEEGASAGEAEGAGAAGHYVLMLVMCLINTDGKFVAAFVRDVILQVDKRPPLR